MIQAYRLGDDVVLHLPRGETAAGFGRLLNIVADAVLWDKIAAGDPAVAAAQLNQLAEMINAANS